MTQLEKFIQGIKETWTRRHFEETLPFISVGILAAIVCSLYALIFAAAERFSEHTLSHTPWLLSILSPIGFCLSFWLVRRFAPGSNGSGIPQVMAVIEKSHRHLGDFYLRKTVIPVKILSSLVAVIGGAAIGREGPSLQVSAAVAHSVGKFFHRFKIPVKMDQLIVTGAASGLAAAFNTPVGGIVYAIEELSQDHLRSFKDVLLISVVISGLTAQLISGNYLYLGFPNVIEKVGLEHFLIVASMSFIAGILGAYFSKILFFLISWRKKKSLRFQIGVLIFAGLVTGLVYFFLGERSIYSGKESILYVLFEAGEVNPLEFLSRFCMPILSSMTGIAGGIFAPSLSAGATFGGMVSTFFDPSLRTILGLSCMVGFLNGVTRTPITSFILVLEMTSKHSSVFPMMMAAVLSSVGAYFVSEHSFYEESLRAIKEEFPSPAE